MPCYMDIIYKNITEISSSQESYRVYAKAITALRLVKPPAQNFQHYLALHRPKFLS